MSSIKILWSSVLGAYEEEGRGGFRIISPNRDLAFNATDFIDSDTLMQLLREYLAPVINRPPLSQSDEDLVDVIKIILKEKEKASSYGIYGKVISIDGKIKYPKVEELLSEIRGR